MEEKDLRDRQLQELREIRRREEKQEKQSDKFMFQRLKEEIVQEQEMLK